MNTLEQIGLTGSEAKVYEALLQLGDSTRSAIVNKSKISGSKIYEVLEKLQDKGLVSIYMKNKIKHFKPTNPNQLLYYLEDEKKKIIELEKQTKMLIPSLMMQFNNSNEEQEVELLQGIKGMESVFREQVEILNKGECNYVIGGTRGTDEGPITAFFRKIHMMREEKGIKTKMLYNIRQKEETEKNYSGKEFSNSTTKYIEHSSPVSINIYKDRTLIVLFAKELSIIHIKSQAVANSFMEYFNIMWKGAKN